MYVRYETDFVDVAAVCSFGHLDTTTTSSALREVTMSPKKLLVLLGPALLAPCAGAEGGTRHAIGLGAVSPMSSSWNKQGLRRGAPPVDGATPRCGALSSQALCVRARGGGVVEVNKVHALL